MTRIVVTFALGLVALSGSARAQQEPPAESGEALAASGDWVGAARAFEAQAAARGDAPSWYRYGVALAMTGDAAGAAIAFRTVQQLDPGFPGIAERIAAAEARASRDLAERLDPAGFLVDDAVTLQARREALERGDLVYAARAATALPSGVGLDADATEAVLLARPEVAAITAVAAVGEDPGAVELYLGAADALRLAARFDAARYYLELYLELGGDPVAAAPVRQAIDRADVPGR